MCVYSMMADHYIEKWGDRINEWPSLPVYQPFWTAMPPPPTPLTQEEIDELRKLLERAKKYDEETGQKDCELEDKKKILMELAKKLGVDLQL